MANNFDSKNDVMPMLTHHAMGFEKPNRSLDFEDDEAPQPEPEPVAVDPFIDEIAKLKKSQSPVVRDTIERAACFGRNWYFDPVPLLEEEDSDEGGICTEVECDLRSLCELVYTRATGRQLEQQKDDAPISYALAKSSDKPEKRKRRVKRKYTRLPYINLGRPVDNIATQLWKLLGGPPSLPEAWAYPPTGTHQAIEDAVKAFVHRFGSGVMVTKRKHYHAFFYNGKHFARLWLSSPIGGWLDTGVELAKAMLKVAPTLKLEDVPTVKASTRYRFFPYRIFLYRRPQFVHLAKVFASLKIAPMPEPIEPEKDEDDAE